MSSYVLYKLKNNNAIKTITFTGTYISKKEVTDFIKKTENYNYDELNVSEYEGREYVHDYDRIHRYSTLEITRVPKINAKKIPKTTNIEFKVDVGGKIREDTQDPSCNIFNDGDLTEDERIDRMVHRFEESAPKYLTRPTVPPPGYVCHKCNIAGHFIDKCPGIKDLFGNFVDRKDWKKPLGIPRNRLVEAEPKAEGAFLDDSGRYYKYAEGAINLNVIKQKALFSAEENPKYHEEKVMVPARFNCNLCNNVINDANQTPCCKVNYCSQCILNKLFDPEIGTGGICPSCSKPIPLIDLLLENPDLNTEIYAWKDSLKKKSQYPEKEKDVDDQVEIMTEGPCTEHYRAPFFRPQKKGYIPCKTVEKTITPLRVGLMDTADFTEDPEMKTLITRNPNLQSLMTPQSRKDKGTPLCQKYIPTEDRRRKLKRSICPAIPRDDEYDPAKPDIPIVEIEALKVLAYHPTPMKEPLTAIEKMDVTPHVTEPDVKTTKMRDRQKRKREVREPSPSNVSKRHKGGDKVMEQEVTNAEVCQPRSHKDRSHGRTEMERTPAKTSEVREPRSHRDRTQIRRERERTPIKTAEVCQPRPHRDKSHGKREMERTPAKTADVCQPRPHRDKSHGKRERERTPVKTAEVCEPRSLRNKSHSKREREITPVKTSEVEKKHRETLAHHTRRESQKSHISKVSTLEDHNFLNKGHRDEEKHKSGRKRSPDKDRRGHDRTPHMELRDRKERYGDMCALKSQVEPVETHRSTRHKERGHHEREPSHTSHRSRNEHHDYERDPYTEDHKGYQDSRRGEGGRNVTTRAYHTRQHNEEYTDRDIRHHQAHGEDHREREYRDRDPSRTIRDRSRRR